MALERDFDGECGLGNSYDDQAQEDMESLRSPVLECWRWQVAALWQESTHSLVNKVLLDCSYAPCVFLMSLH